MGRFLLVLLAVLLSVFSRGATPAQENATLEFWFYRPTFRVPIVSQEAHLGDISLNADPSIVSKGTIATLKVENVVWDETKLSLGQMVGTLSSKELVGTAKVKVLNQTITQPLGSFPGVKLTLKSRSATQLSFPERMLLRPRVEQGQVAFSVVDDALKTQIDAQVDTLLSAAGFNRFFHPIAVSGFPDILKKSADMAANQARGTLLEKAREELKKSLSSDALSKLLVLSSQSLPTQIPAELMAVNWVLQRVPFRNSSALWRLAPADSPVLADPTRLFPAATDASRNLVTAVLSNGLVQSHLDHGLEQGLSSSLGLVLGQGVKATLVASGDRGPKVRAWSMPGKGRQRHFLDILVCLKENGGEQANHPFGMTIEFAEQGRPRLIALVPLETVAMPSLQTSAPEAWASLEQVVAGAFIQSVGNGKLDGKHWVSGSKHLLPLGIRTLGQGGRRNPGTSFESHWAPALALDFQLSLE